eukprot:TRINITY_DN1485_c0_g1_i3.p1 TRINITY_DN1485_c0_g1~~TRINITY_DN1485_c0_g1_i3.p1  ORF type:complete len:759 (+),score=189.13 TRINITY_DN1485_c0_g1_i3:40-2316(+)
MNHLREAVSKEKKRLRLSNEGFNLDLSYITDNIVAMGFPSEGFEGAFRNQMSEIIRFLEKYHRDKYMVYNLCAERVYLPLKFNNQMRSFPFYDHNPPAMSLLREFCLSLEYFLALDSENVAVIHCKAGKGRTGVVICCYLMHCGQCATTDEAMRFYAAARTNDGKGVTIASQQRYVRYYEKLLSILKGMEPGRPFSSPQLYIKRLRLANLSTSVKTAYIRIVCRSRKYKSLTQKVKKESRSIAFNFKEPAPVREDVKISVYEKDKVELFTFWFNTGFIEEDLILVLQKNELDRPKSGKDKTKSFPQDFSIYVTFLDDAQLRMSHDSKNGRMSTSKSDMLRAEDYSGAESDAESSRVTSHRFQNNQSDVSESELTEYDSEEEDEENEKRRHSKKSKAKTKTKKKDKGKEHAIVLTPSSNGNSSSPFSPRRHHSNSNSNNKTNDSPEVSTPRSRPAGPDFSKRKANTRSGTVLLTKEKLAPNSENSDGLTLSPHSHTGIQTPRRVPAAALDFSGTAKGEQGGEGEGDGCSTPRTPTKSPRKSHVGNFKHNSTGRPKASSEQSVILSRSSKPDLDAGNGDKKDRRRSQEAKLASNEISNTASEKKKQQKKTDNDKSEKGKQDRERAKTTAAVSSPRRQQHKKQSKHRGDGSGSGSGSGSSLRAKRRATTKEGTYGRVSSSNVTSNGNHSNSNNNNNSNSSSDLLSKEKHKKEDHAKEKKKRLRTTSFNASRQNGENDKLPTTPKASRRDLKKGTQSSSQLL